MRWAVLLILAVTEMFTKKIGDHVNYVWRKNSYMTETGLHNPIDFLLTLNIGHSISTPFLTKVVKW